MALAKVLINGGTKEQRLREAMKAAVESLIEEQHETLKGFYKMKANNNVIFVTQKSKEECNTLLTEVLNELKEEFSISPHNRKFFTPWRFRLEQEHSNSSINFITLDELFNNLSDYVDNTETVNRSVIAEFGVYRFLENSEVLYQLFTGGRGLTYFVAIADEDNIYNMEDFSPEEFQTTVTLRDETNEHLWNNSVGKEKVEEKQTTEESSIFDLFGKDFDSHAETLKELASEWSNSINEYLSTLDDATENNEASESTETDESKLRMFTLIEERRQFAENTYNPDANYTLGYMDALYDLEQKLKTLK